MPQGAESAKRIDLAIGHGNPLVLTAMSEAFESDSRFSLVSTAATAEGFLDTVERVRVEVGVIDWRLPLMGGAKLCEILRDRPEPPRIIIYGGEDVDGPRLAMAAGAAGYAPRHGPVEALLQICHEVASGKMVFPFVDIRALQADPIQSLSRRERTILDALATGLTNRQLAQELDISMNTVKFHLSNLYDKLSVKNRTQAIALYYRSRMTGE